jgi:transposase
VYDKEVVMVRHRLTEEQWNRVRPHIPVSTARTGRPARDPRQMLDGILWVLVTGAAWRDLPEAFGPWETVYYYFALWQRTGVFFRIVEALQVQLDEAGKLDWSAWCVDGTSIRASRAAGGASQKVSIRTSWNLKITPWAIPVADSAPRCIS